MKRRDGGSVVSLALPATAIAALQKGHTVEAIKIVRASTGLGLREAKEQVDAWLDTHSEHRRDIEEQSATSARFAGLALVVAAAAALLIWLVAHHHPL